MFPLVLLVAALVHTSVAQFGPWISMPTVPDDLGEVTSAIVNNNIYLFGREQPKTYAFNVATNQWRSDLAQRPLPGHHHAAVVSDDNKIWLVGGLEKGSEGKIQVYNPATNTWGQPFSMPANLIKPAGSMVAVHVAGKIYICGGMPLGEEVQGTCVIYNIQTATFSQMAPLPAPVNHMAFATDGSNIYVAGGRQVGNYPHPGVDFLQIYNIASGKWTWSGAQGSTLAPLPQKRGGMGTGLIINGNFHVIGGETDNNANPVNGVYKRYDIYNIATNTWTRGTDMPKGRHGIYPVTDGKFVYVLSGGIVSGDAMSDIAEKIAVSVVCPSSNQKGIMLCRDGSSCNVATQGYGCCSARQGRLACPLEKPVLCPNSCSNDYCCAATLSECTGAPKALTACPSRITTTTKAPPTTTSKRITTTTKKATTTTTKRATTTTNRRTTTTQKPSSCPHSGVANSLRCGNGALCDVTTKGWNCCASIGGRKACPASRPIMCAAKTCNNDYCCDFSNAANPCGGKLLSKCP